MAKYTDVDLLQPNVELDADIKALVTKEPETLVKDLQALGIDSFAAIKRGAWFTQHIKTHPEYGEAVDAKVNQILGPSILTVEKIDLFSDDAQWEALKGLGLDPTPETLEFINQLADSAIAGTPLAQPYIAVGAVVLHKSALGQGVDVTSVSFHQTKLAEMVKHPQRFAD